MNTEKTSLKRTLVGRVVSSKMDKTVTVLVERKVKHAVYGKYVVRSTRFHAHDETNQINEGDLVEIAETRPLSRTKTWTVTRVVQAAAAWGIPTPGLMVSLAYFDAFRSSRLPANLIQAQRDYFGAHTYERLDQPRGQFFHTNWTGRGGTTASTTYTV